MAFRPGISIYQNHVWTNLMDNFLILGLPSDFVGRLRMLLLRCSSLAILFQAQPSPANSRILAIGNTSKTIITEIDSIGHQKKYLDQEDVEFHIAYTSILAHLPYEILVNEFLLL